MGISRQGRGARRVLALAVTYLQRARRKQVVAVASSLKRPTAAAHQEAAPKRRPRGRE